MCVCVCVIGVLCVVCVCAAVIKTPYVADVRLELPPTNIAPAVSQPASLAALSQPPIITSPSEPGPIADPSQQTAVNADPFQAPAIAEPSQAVNGDAPQQEGGEGVEVPDEPQGVIVQAHAPGMDVAGKEWAPCMEVNTHTRTHGKSSCALYC